MDNRALALFNFIDDDDDDDDELFFVVWLTDERRLHLTCCWDHCQIFSPSQISNML